MTSSFIPIRPDRPVLNIHEKNGVVWLSSPLLDKEPGLLHGFSTRAGGVSRGHLSSMNLSFERESGCPENVRENFRRISEAVGFPTDSMVFSSQMHTVNVLKVGKKDTGCGFSREYGWDAVDGFVTDEEGVTLAVFAADCVPVLFFDPVRRAVGAAHSGWRGTAAGMASVLVRRMSREFGTDPADLLACIGPSICGQCYEVSKEVALQFPESCRTGRENGKYLVDLRKANRLLLEEAGLTPSHISDSNLCTACNSSLLFSHRASGGKRGVMAGFISLGRKA